MGLISAAIILAQAERTTAQDSLRLAPGDTLSFTLLGAPSFSREVRIGPSGHVQLPLIGSVDAGGLKLPALQSYVRERAANLSYRIVGPSGDEYWYPVHAEQIMIDVAAYSPVYVDGDVGEPGLVPYRPNLSVRQALAQAGGRGRAGLGEERRRLLLLELPTRQNTLLREIQTRETELAAVSAVLDSIDEEPSKEAASGDAGTDRDRLAAADGAAAGYTRVGAELPAFEQAWTRSTLRSFRRSGRATEAILAELRDRMSVLRRQLDKEKQAVAFDEKEVERVNELFERGLTTTNAIVQARRALLFSSMRTLDTNAELGRISVEIAQISQRDQRERTERHLRLLDRAKTLRSELSSLRAELDGINDQLSAVGQSVGADTTIFVTVLRDGDELAEANLGTGLLPGDMVEVVVVRVPAQSN